jgi:membrane protease YdiL (CAAX protease family)
MDIHSPSIDQSPTTRWRGRDFALVMIAGLVVGGALYAAGTELGWGDETLLVTSAFGQYGGHILALVAMARRRGGGASLGLSVSPSDTWYVGLGLILQATLPLLFLPIANLAGEGEAGQVVSDQIQQLGGPGTRIAMAIVVVVLAPITEEVMFRGVLLKALGGFGRLAAIVVSGLVFAGFHLFGLSGDLLRGALLVVPTFFVMGVILARVTVKKDRLGPAIFIHSGFNLLAYLILLMPPELVDRLLEAQ